MKDRTPSPRAWTSHDKARSPLQARAVGVGILALAALSLPARAVTIAPPAAPAAADRPVVAAATERPLAAPVVPMTFDDRDVVRASAGSIAAAEAAEAKAAADRRKAAKAKKAAKKAKAAEAAAVAPPPAPAPPPVFANVAGVEVVVPATDAKIVGFHEAAYPVALPMLPLGNPLVNDNITKHANPVPTPGPNFVIMSTRGRPHAATSAVDIVPEHGERILAPVTGTVVTVRPYDLYGKYPDNRIEIVPDARPDLKLTILHVAGPQVVPGQHVHAGETVIAQQATHFPFDSHVDAYAGGKPAHVHIETKVNE